jgi:hypothetical protein
VLLVNAGKSGKEPLTVTLSACILVKSGIEPSHRIVMADP